MSRVTVLCGLPRSGKSTWAKQHRREGEVIVSADQLRYLVYGQRFWSDGEPLLWAIRGIVLRMLMEQKIDLIIDETNTTPERRAPILKLAKEYGYEAEAVVVPTPKEVCIQRAQLEGDEIIIPVIERMASQWQPPVYDEGFSLIRRVTEWRRAKEGASDA